MAELQVQFWHCSWQWLEWKVLLLFLVLGLIFVCLFVFVFTRWLPGLTVAIFNKNNENHNYCSLMQHNETIKTNFVPLFCFWFFLCIILGDTYSFHAGNCYCKVVCEWQSPQKDLRGWSPKTVFNRDWQGLTYVQPSFLRGCEMHISRMPLTEKQKISMLTCLRILILVVVRHWPPLLGICRRVMMSACPHLRNYSMA